MREMYLPERVRFIIDRLEAKGHVASVVGGCVRDFLLSRPVNDYDLTTSATPTQIKAAFSDFNTVDTGIKHGTVTVVIDKRCYEITTYRTDGDYKDNRHPETVNFTSSLEEDLARRDFTVNAIAYNPTVGYTDPFGGMADLEGRLIRAVGDPEKRFDEDGLRIMRAIRFSSVLGFSIEEDTARAIHGKRELLRNIARERLNVEWRKLMSGEGAYEILSEYSDVIAVFLPELENLVLPDREAFLGADTTARMLSLFYLSCRDSESSYESAMRELRSDNSTRVGGVGVLRAVKSLSLSSLRDALISLSVHGAEATLGALRLLKLLGKTGQDEEKMLDAALSSGIPYTLGGLDIKGGDVAGEGYRGEEIGEQLSRLLRAVIEGECENERGKLIAYLRGK